MRILIALSLLLLAPALSPTSQAAELRAARCNCAYFYEGWTWYARKALKMKRVGFVDVRYDPSDRSSLIRTADRACNATYEDIPAKASLVTEPGSCRDL